MNRKTIFLVAAIGSSLALAAAPVHAANSANGANGAKGANGAQVERGKYLVQIMVCNDCHTPLKMTPRGPEPDMSRMLSGHPQDFVITSAPEPGKEPWAAAFTPTNTAWAGPWGVSFTANLTPDPETGLGRWTAEQFIATIRTGRHLGSGRPILPPMPYPQYRNATDEDLRAVFAYLQSIPAIQNRVPQPIEPAESR